MAWLLLAHFRPDRSARASSGRCLMYRRGIACAVLAAATALSLTSCSGGSSSGSSGALTFPIGVSTSLSAGNSELGQEAREAVQDLLRVGVAASALETEGASARLR